MDAYWDVIQKSGLFEGVEAVQLPEMLGCLSPRRARFGQGEAILSAGAHTRSFGLLLRGGAHIVQEDYWGNRNIIAALEPGELFAESFAARPEEVLSVSVVTSTESEVMFLELSRLLSTCPSACPHHRRIIENLVAILAGKNQRLNAKLRHVCQRTTREKLLSYLSEESRRRGSDTFEIPFNRLQLADYLCVDRSARSTELGRLKADGLLDFYRNCFKMKR